MPNINISKLDAAKRQLDVAVSMFFKNADAIAVHTLTAASHQILMDLGKLEGIFSVIKGNPFIKKGMEKEYFTIINEAENFFKHAKKDPKELLEFNPDQTTYLLIDAVEMYIQLTSEMPEDMSIFRVWFLLNHPKIVSEETRGKLSEKNIDVQRYILMTKTDFYRTMKDSLSTE